MSRIFSIKMLGLDLDRKVHALTCCGKFGCYLVFFAVLHCYVCTSVGHSKFEWYPVWFRCITCKHITSNSDCNLVAFQNTLRVRRRWLMCRFCHKTCMSYSDSSCCLTAYLHIVSCPSAVNLQMITFVMQVDLHGMHVEEALNVLENHLLNLGGLGCPSGILLQVGFEFQHKACITCAAN